MKKKYLVILVAVAVLGVIAVKLIENKSIINEKNQIKPEINTLVNVYEVKMKELGGSLSLTGITQAKQEVTLKSQTGGQIVSVNFNVSDYVIKGKVLVTIDAELAKLGLESTKLNLAKTEDEYNKYRNLYAGQAAAETKLRDAKFDYEKAKLAVEQAEKQLSYTNITATQNGYIVSKFVDNGTLVTIGTPIISIADISQLKVLIKASENNAYRLKIGMNVSITSSVYPGVKYNGKVTSVSQQGDALHNYPIEIRMDNNSNYVLKSGTYVNVDIDFPSGKPILLIPREALIGSIKNAKIYVIENNRALLKDITIGSDLGNYLEVLSGMNEGDRVVTSGQINLSDGLPVSIVNK